MIALNGMDAEAFGGLLSCQGQVFFLKTAKKELPSSHVLFAG
jgi:hypothetical protein